LGHYASECANQRIMILRDDGEIEFTIETSNCDNMPPLMDDSDVEYAHNRENIFHTRCQIQNKVWNRIVDSGSYATVTSVTLIRKCC